LGAAGGGRAGMGGTEWEVPLWRRVGQNTLDAPMIKSILLWPCPYEVTRRFPLRVGAVGSMALPPGRPLFHTNKNKPTRECGKNITTASMGNIICARTKRDFENIRHWMVEKEKNRVLRAENDQFLEEMSPELLPGKPIVAVRRWLS